MREIGYFGVEIEEIKMNKDEIKNNEMMHVVFCLNNKYAEPTGVAAYSLCKNMAAEDNVVLHIIMTEPLQEFHKEKFRLLERLFAPKVQVRIYENVERISRLFQELKEVDLHRFGISACVRLVLGEILSDEVHKVIYLDGDILVNTSLRGLWYEASKLVSPYIVGAIPDGYVASTHACDEKCQKGMLKYFHDHYPEMKFSSIFQTGTLVINLDLMRRENSGDACVKWLSSHRAKWPDSEALNIVFHSRILELKGKYNTYYIRSQINNPSGIVVAHFASAPKPWDFRDAAITRPLKDWEQRYLDLWEPTWKESPWGNLS
jgi:lipopolysaccharide biosynthesis glycosyltransferase